MVKNLPTCEGDTGLISGSGRSPREGNGNPLHYSFLGKSWTEEAGGLQYMSHRRVGHDMATKQQLLNVGGRGLAALVSSSAPALLPAGCAVC